jgi:hypothetical protein
MPRTAIALFAAFAFLAAYLAAVMAASDYIVPLHWALQALFFLAAGVLWVPPVHFLILWAAGKVRK